MSRQTGGRTTVRHDETHLGSHGRRARGRGRRRVLRHLRRDHLQCQYLRVPGLCVCEARLRVGQRLCADLQQLLERLQRAMRRQLLVLLLQRPELRSPVRHGLHDRVHQHEHLRRHMRSRLPIHVRERKRLCADGGRGQRRDLHLHGQLRRCLHWQLSRSLLFDGSLQCQLLRRRRRGAVEVQRRVDVRRNLLRHWRAPPRAPGPTGGMYVEGHVRGRQRRRAVGRSR